MYRNSVFTGDYDAYVESEYKLGANKDWIGGSDKVLIQVSSWRSS